MIDVSDMIGLPYKLPDAEGPGMDCLACGIEALRRLGRTLPARVGDRDETAIVEWISSPESPWRAVGDDVARVREVGDIIETHPTATLPAGISVYLGEQFAITALPGHGVRLIPLRKLTGPLTVWRWVG